LIPASLARRRVLVVDDNATNRKVVAGQLALCGVDTASATCAQEALALMRQAAAEARPFEVALIDSLMPDCDGAELGRRIAEDRSLNSTRLILLTSAALREEADLFARLGFAGYLLKPIALQNLVDCLTMALSNGAEAWHMQSVPMITEAALQRQRPQAGRKILLAEDNPVNQKVATRLLEKLGYQVAVARSGEQAVAEWRRGRFDLILMDCQMPQMDGYDATREIRRLEGNARRIPIVALTADAMSEVKDKCRAAGMDDYLTKPIDRKKLEDCLNGFLLRSDPRDGSGDTNAPADASGPPRNSSIGPI
jgi:CheY-like chemotaxis protein